jgi:carboxyl-terminal processing protease
MESRPCWWNRPSTLVVLLFAAFTLGALVDRTGWISGVPRGEPASAGAKFAPFWEAWNVVEAKYVDRKAVDPTNMTQGAIRGMLESLGDTGHTSYLTPKEYEELESSLNGHFEGIGALMTIREGRATVSRPMPGSPAEKAGLRPGDVLIEVDGKDVRELPLSKVVEMVRGPAGTTVKLEVLRQGEAKPIELAIKRGKVEIADVTWHMLPGTSIAHVALHSFGEKADEQLKAAVAEARKQGAKGLLLDLRGNPGGLKDQAIAVTSEFLNGGNVFIDVDAQGKQEPVAVTPGGTIQDLPMVVLIDEGTASSAEILAGALQDYHRAKLVGTKTFGTGTVLGQFRLSDGSAIMVAVSEWLTPNGRKMWHEGIVPDEKVALPAGAMILMPEEEENLDAAALAKSTDKQLLRALELLQQQLDGKGPAAK